AIWWILGPADGWVREGILAPATWWILAPAKGVRGGLLLDLDVGAPVEASDLAVDQELGAQHEDEREAGGRGKGFRADDHRDAEQLGVVVGGDQEGEAVAERQPEDDGEHEHQQVLTEEDGGDLGGGVAEGAEGGDLVVAFGDV